MIDYDKEKFTRMHEEANERFKEWMESNKTLDELDYDEEDFEKLPVAEKLKYMAFKLFKDTEDFYNKKPTPNVNISGSSEARVSYIGEYSEEDLSNAVELLKELFTENNYKILIAQSFKHTYDSGSEVVGFTSSVYTPQAEE